MPERTCVEHTLDPRDFKDMMAKVATTITVVTAPGDAEPIGLTVSAFQSVSAEPPIVLVCIDKSVGSLDFFLHGKGFTVNFLPDGTQDLAMVFATKGTDRFGSTLWSTPAIEDAGPVLDDAYGHFACRTVGKIEMGDHWIFFGEVAEGGLTDARANPLIWHDRGFAHLEGQD